MKQYKNRVINALALILAAILSLSMLGAAPANSGSGDSAVYVMTDADGAANKVIVTESVKNQLSGKGSGGAVLPVTDSDGNTVDYRGDIEKELPIALKVSYTLDGKDISPEKLSGKSGHVVIRFDYENLQYAEKTINGETQKIYVPFAVLTGAVLDGEKFSNVQVSSGKVVSDGSRMIVVGIALPGLQEDLDIDGELLNIPGFVEICADVKDFSLSMTLTVVTDELFKSDELDKLYDVGDLTSAVNKLNDAISQLTAGSSQLYDGLCTLLDQSDALVGGVNALSDGLNQLAANNDSLSGGAYTVFTSLLNMAQEQISAAGLPISGLTVSNYAEVLNGLIDSLDENAVYQQALEQVTQAVYAQEDTVRAAVTEVVREQVTEAVKAAVNAQVRQQVEAAVREHEPEIRQGVTEQVRLQVEAKVIEAARAQVLSQVLAKFHKSMEDYEAMNVLEKAVIDKAVDVMMQTSQVQQTISENIEAQMQSEEVQAIISEQVENYIQAKVGEQLTSEEILAKIDTAVNENVESKMQSPEIQATIEENTQNQITKLIADNMASDAVQSQLQAAAEGAQSIIKLKASLDSYAGFYYGLLSYTSGVASAAEGAGTLKDKVPALVSGIKQLRDGAGSLKNGIIRFNSEGISKLTGALEGTLGGLTDRLQAAVDAARDFSGNSALRTGGEVNFIYRTAAIG